MSGLHINEARKRGSELEMVVLKFLHTETYSNFKNLLELTRIDKSNLSRLLKRLAKKNMLKKHELIFDTHNVLLWGILDEGIHQVADLENAPLNHFQPKKMSISTINHTLMNQRVRIATHHLGWRHWENSDRKKFISKYPVKHRPDSIVTNPNGIVMAIETELTLKTALRYRSIVQSHVEAMKNKLWHNVIYVVRDDEYKKMLNRRFDGIKYVQFDLSRHDFDKKYRDWFYIFTIEELRELEMKYQMNFKDLIYIWDKASYNSKFPTTKTEEVEDGLSACKRLYEMDALADESNSESVLYEFSVNAYQNVLTKLREKRSSIEKAHDSSTEQWGDKLNQTTFFSSHHSMELNIDEKSLCRASGLLIKIFRAANNYNYLLYRALINSVISEDLYNTRHKELTNFLKTTLDIIIEAENDLTSGRRSLLFERAKAKY